MEPDKKFELFVGVVNVFEESAGREYQKIYLEEYTRPIMTCNDFYVQIYEEKEGHLDPERFLKAVEYWLEWILEIEHSTFLCTVGEMDLYKYTFKGLKEHATHSKKFDNGRGEL